MYFWRARCNTLIYILLFCLAACAVALRRILMLLHFKHGLSLVISEAYRNGFHCVLWSVWHYEENYSFSHDLCRYDSCGWIRCKSDRGWQSLTTGKTSGLTCEGPISNRSELPCTSSYLRQSVHQSTPFALLTFYFVVLLRLWWRPSAHMWWNCPWMNTALLLTRKRELPWLQSLQK